MIAQASLFDAPAQPVLGAARAWLESLLGGSMVPALCVLAIALLGLMMLGGRLPIRTGVQVVLGCFLLLGAPLVARELQSLAQAEAGDASTITAVVAPTSEPAKPLPPANYDPYAGASLRRD